jgi:hypothetical protein
VLKASAVAPLLEQETFERRGEVEERLDVSRCVGDGCGKPVMSRPLEKMD